MAKRYRDIIEEVVRLCPEGNVLDVGTGIGSFLVTLSEFGIHAVGIEPNEAQAAYAQEHGLTVVNDLLREGLFDEQFGVITFLQVLEHVTDPVDSLRIARDYLNDDGVIIISVPSYNNPRFLLYRALRLRSIVQRDFIPSHLFYYTPRTLRGVVQAAGLKVMKLQCGRYSVKFGPHPLLEVLDRLITRLEIGGIVLYCSK